MPRLASTLRRIYGHPTLLRARRAVRANEVASRAVDRLLALPPADRLLGNVRRPPGPPACGPFDLATRDDLRYCYRLLLRREPDPAGWDFWVRNIDKGIISLNALTTSFLGSEEFRRRHGEAHSPPETWLRRLVDVGEFSIYTHDGDHAIGAPLASTGVYEPHVVEALRPLLGPGSVFVDVGANIGYFTLLAAAVAGPTGRVVAVEPNPANCALIGLSVEENGFSNVVVHCRAAADRHRMFVLETDGSNGRVLSFHPSDEPTAVPASYVVEGVALDSLLADLPRVDVVKIDIEGAEPVALRGMEALLRRHRPALITEFFPVAIRSTSESEPAAYLDSLRALGYELVVIGDSGAGDVPLDNEGIMRALERSGSDHVDLLARVSPSAGISATDV